MFSSPESSGNNEHLGDAMCKGRSRRRAGALHLVDAENLAGDPFSSRASALTAIHEFADLAGAGSDDLTFISGNRFLLDDVVFELPFTARVRHASGPDGADRSLLADASPDWVCRRFRRLVIGSGDHIFGDLAAAALEAGLEVTVVARPGCVSHVFADLGCEVRYLGDRSTAECAA